MPNLWLQDTGKTVGSERGNVIELIHICWVLLPSTFVCIADLIIIPVLKRKKLGTERFTDLICFKS